MLNLFKALNKTSLLSIIVILMLSKESRALECPTNAAGYVEVNKIIKKYNSYVDVVRTTHDGRNPVGYSSYYNIGQSVLVVYETLRNVQNTCGELFERFINEVKVLSRVSELEGQIKFEGFDYAVHPNNKDNFLAYIKLDKKGSFLVPLPQENGIYKKNPDNSDFYNTFYKNSIDTKLGNLKNIGRSISRFNNAGIIHCNISPLSIIYDNEWKNYANAYKFNGFGNSFLISDEIRQSCSKHRPVPMKELYFIPEHMERDQEFHPQVYDSWGFGMLCIDLLLIHFGESYPRLHDVPSINAKYDFIYTKDQDGNFIIKKQFIRFHLLKGFKNWITKVAGYSLPKYSKEVNHFTYVFLEFIDYLLDYILNDNLGEIPTMKTIVQDFDFFQKLMNDMSSLATRTPGFRTRKPINMSFGDRTNFNNIYFFGKDENYSMFVLREGVTAPLKSEVEIQEHSRRQTTSQVKKKKTMTSPHRSSLNISRMDTLSRTRQNQSSVKQLSQNQASIKQSGVKQSRNNSVQSLQESFNQSLRESMINSIEHISQSRANFEVQNQEEENITQFIDFDQLTFAIVADYLETKRKNCIVRDIPQYGTIPVKEQISPYQALAIKPTLMLDFDYFCFASSSRSNAGIKQTYVTWSQLI